MVSLVRSLHQEDLLITTLNRNLNLLKRVAPVKTEHILKIAVLLLHHHLKVVALVLMEQNQFLVAHPQKDLLQNGGYKILFN